MTVTPDTAAIGALTSISLERNLKALAKLNRDLAASLAEVEPYGPDEMEFVETEDGVPSARLGGRWLASRRRPLAEVPGLAEKANVREKPIVVLLGFGLGYHVREIADRMGAKGAVLVFEPDLRLLRTVLERLEGDWLGRGNLLFFTDPEDGAALSGQLRGQDPYVAQGVQFVEHPPSKARLGESATTFSTTFTNYVAATKLSVQTTLVQMQATARNILANLKQYAGGEGILELRDCCKGFPAIVVSAGPSLAKNVALLKQPGVRERCVIIAVQTVLKPLLAQGIRPHFVTALDYHEISRRFYEGLTEEDVRAVQLVCEAKSNPAILDSFPGPIRNCADPLAKRVLHGAIDRDMGRITAGATVAHLAFYLAQALGCDPIALIGQDLGFTDGLYYGGRNPIHDVWGPELNPFRTLEMFEWERIKRNGSRLKKREDHGGRPIFVDDQMHTYQDQFER
ncbi:MAG: motility associated factor glycosyltransferase family protein, partial [Phycisphaerales bacterium JB038]